MSSGGIRKWPGGDDPRAPCFCTGGFRNRYPAPWHLMVEVRDATGAAAVFNGDHICEFAEDVLGDGEWCKWVAMVGEAYITIAKLSGDYGPPAPATLYWTIQFTNPLSDPPIELGEGWEAAYPMPGADWPPITPGGAEDLFPTPVRVIAKPYDFELP